MPSKQSPVARIINLLALERTEITAVYFYAILNGLIQLSLPVGVQAIIGFVIGASMRASLVVLIILVVTGVLVAGIMQVNQMKIIEKIQQKIFARYAFAFAEHIPVIDLHRNDHAHLPELMNRFFDIPVLQKSLSKILLDIPTASVQIIFGLLLLSFYHPVFILFGVVLMLLLWLIIKYSSRQGVQTSLHKSTFKYKVAAWLEETARMAKSIKFKNHGQWHLSKSDNNIGNYLMARTSHFKVLLFQFNVLIIFKTIITAAMLIVGTFLLVGQQINIGQFIAAEIVILLMLTSVEKLIVNLGSVYDSLTAVEKLSNLTDTAAEASGPLIMEGDAAGLKVEMRNFSFGYDPELPVCSNVNLTVLPGEKVCITGKYGSGKSTLLRLMAGLYSGYTGSLLINDIPLANYNLSSVRSKISLLVNEHDIFAGTLWENITLGDTSVEMETVTSYAEAIGLMEFISSLHNGYNTMLDPAGRRLPSKIAYKILLLRALVPAPRLLLIEDPWVNMQPLQQQKFFELLNGLTGTTVIIASSDEALVKGCHKRITLQNGKVNLQPNF